MSRTTTREDRPTAGESDETGMETDAELLAVELEALRDENDRLRTAYARTRQIEYRRSAIGMALLGLASVVGAFLFPDSRTVLVSLGGTGLFAAFLTYYLTPERVMTATVGERVYDALASNHQALVTELGLRDDRLYVPLGDATGVRLFVPQRADFTLPSVDDLQRTLVVTEDDRRRGIALRPTGEALFEAFDRSVAGNRPTDPIRLTDQLADGIVETFELADQATPEVGNSRATVAITGSAHGRINRFDHPIPSLLAVGLARGLDRPISLSVTTADDDRADYLVTCEWEPLGSDELDAAGTESTGAEPERRTQPTDEFST